MVRFIYSGFIPVLLTIYILQEAYKIFTVDKVIGSLIKQVRAHRSLDFIQFYLCDIRSRWCFPMPKAKTSSTT